jgi:cholera toxin transcriptional activator
MESNPSSSGSGQRAVVRFGVFEADLRSGELRKQGLRLKLQGQPFDILAILLQRPGEVVTRDELRQALWPEDTYVDFDHSLNTAINKLRTALGDSGSNPRFVETLARRGYRFIAPVTVGDEKFRAMETVTQADGGVVGENAVERSNTASRADAASLGDEALPKPARGLVRVMFELVQVMYLSMYVAALWHLSAVERAAGALPPRLSLAATILVVVLAAAGIPVRFYMFFAVGFDYRWFGPKFRRLFPASLVLDELWALTPFLLAERIGLGLAFAATAALLYLPFGQRTLVRMGYWEIG